MIPVEIIRCPTISNQTFRVFGIMVSFAPAHPSYSVIVKIAGIRRAAVSYRIKELKARKILSYMRGNGVTRVNQYFINSNPDDWDLRTETSNLVLDGRQLGPLDKRSTRTRRWFGNQNLTIG